MKQLFDTFLQNIQQNNMVINYVQIYKEGKLAVDYGRLPSKTRLNSWSLSKSVISIITGIAIDEGYLTLEEKVCESFREYLPTDCNSNLKELSVRHLLTMTAGLETPLFFADDTERVMTEDWIAYFFRQSFPYRPGERFLYSNFNTYILGCLIEKKTGRDLLDYMNEKLFHPLEIYSADWTRCPKGHLHAANGLYLNIDEFARIGMLLLNHGVYHGRQIISQKYLDMATVNQIEHNPPEDGYGFQFWVNPDKKSYRADGKYGQYLIILPEKNTLVATMALDAGPVFETIWEDICEKI